MSKADTPPLHVLLHLRNRPVILIGEGEVAEAQRRLLEQAGARIVREGAQARIAVVVGDPAALSRMKVRGLLVYAVDRPELSDFTIAPPPLPALAEPRRSSGGLAETFRRIGRARRERPEPPAAIVAEAETEAVADVPIEPPAPTPSPVAPVIPEPIAPIDGPVPGSEPIAPAIAADPTPLVDMTAEAEPEADPPQPVLAPPEPVVAAPVIAAEASPPPPVKPPPPVPDDSPEAAAPNDARSGAFLVGALRAAAKRARAARQPREPFQPDLASFMPPPDDAPDDAPSDPPAEPARPSAAFRLSVSPLAKAAQPEPPPAPLPDAAHEPPALRRPAFAPVPIPLAPPLEPAPSVAWVAKPKRRPVKDFQPDLATFMAPPDAEPPPEPEPVSPETARQRVEALLPRARESLAATIEAARSAATLLRARFPDRSGETVALDSALAKGGPLDPLALPPPRDEPDEAGDDPHTPAR